MIGAAMSPSTGTAAPTIPVAIANTVAVRITTRNSDPRNGASARTQREEKALHQPGLLDEIAHEDEERYGGKQLVAHEADGLEEREVEHPALQHQRAEAERRHEEREGHREADEDRPIMTSSMARPISASMRAGSSTAPTALAGGEGSPLPAPGP